MPVVSISAGDEFAVALTVGGFVYSWGANERGQLGLGHGEDVVETPTRIEMLDVASVATGFDYAWCVRADGTAHCFGNPDDFPSVPESQVTVREGMRCVQSPACVWTKARADALDARVVAACAGDNANILLTSTGNLIGCGLNSMGELGVGDDEPRRELVHLGGAQLQREYVVKVSTSLTMHTLAMTADGKLFGFGRNTSGELDCTANQAYESPKLIPISGVTDIFAGRDVSYVVRNGTELLCLHGEHGGSRLPGLDGRSVGGMCGGKQRPFYPDGLLYLASPTQQSDSRTERLYEWTPGEPVDGIDHQAVTDYE